MNLQKHKLLGCLAAMVFVGVMVAPGIAAAQEIAVTAGAEVQTRGPVHEAFAGTVSFNPEVGIIVDQAPPALIEEVPPEQRLEGSNVSWIPGYWGWDEDQSDFLWISGIWRNLPPDREWVPGYWAQTEGRHQWTSGYWEDSQTTEVTYLPKPPRSVEVGPNIEASSNEQTWVPGNWIYRDDRYAWRAGYWVAAREDWSWTPAYYRWTQRGYVYVDGYWDYPVVRRGVVFAPVRFEVGYVSRPGFYYTPAAVISLAVFTNHLFLRPNYGHYYYGDYYEPRYRDRGYFASYSYNSSRYGCDPIYTQYRWENRNDRNWDRQRQDYYEYRRDHADARPPRSWAALSARPQGDRNRADYEVAERFDRVASTREGGQRFQKVDSKDRERYISQKQEIRKYGKEREQLETRKDKLDATGGKEPVSVSKEKINRSPVMAKKSDRSDKDGGPPERLQPRASETVQKMEKSDKAGNDPKTTGEDPPQVKRPNDGTVARESDPASKRKGKTAAAPETRVRPGEQREKEPTAQGKEKRQADPTQERQANPAPKRQADPTPERKANPTPKREAEPQSARKVDKPQTRQASPRPTEQKSVKKAQPQRQAELRPQPQKPQPQPWAVPKQNKAQPDRPNAESTNPDKKKKKAQVE